MLIQYKKKLKLFQGLTKYLYLYIFQKGSACSCFKGHFNGLISPMVRKLVSTHI
jgi:hypothetical protein